MEVGIVPARELNERFRSSNDVSKPIAVGIGPIRKLFLRLRNCREVMLPMVVGIVKLIELSPTSNLVILPKLPISDGR